MDNQDYTDAVIEREFPVEEMRLSTEPRTRVIDCWMCSGTGTHQSAGTECHLCEGVGRVRVQVLGPDGHLPRSEEEIRAAVKRAEQRMVLTQTEVWFDADGNEIRLEDMSLRYLKNVLGFLERRADRLKRAAEAQIWAWSTEPHGDMAQDSLDRMYAEIEDQQAMTWLYDQPLVRQIDYLIKIEHDGPVN